ncbi:MAG: hypothetical protein IJW28_01295 [Clostridia bacterium]|nr:hypothetical protein [Clostridia bacterium]
MNDNKTRKEILDMFFNDSSNKKLMEDIIQYTPNYISRYEIIKDSCLNNNIEILKDSSASYINIIPLEWKTLFKSKNLGEYFFYLQICNNSSTNTTIHCYFDFSSKDKNINKVYAQQFYSHIHHIKNLSKELNQDRSIGYSIPILSKDKEYKMSEIEKQKLIKHFFINFFKNDKVLFLDTMLREFVEKL